MNALKIVVLYIMSEDRKVPGIRALCVVQGICMKLHLVTRTLLPLRVHTFATAVHLLMEIPEKLLLVWQYLKSFF